MRRPAICGWVWSRYRGACVMSGKNMCEVDAELSGLYTDLRLHKSTTQW